MVETKKQMVKKILTGTFILVMCAILVIPSVTVQAASKNGVAKKTVTITLDNNKPLKTYYIKAKKSSDETEISIKITKMKGKPEGKKINFLCECLSEGGKGSLLYDFNTKNFKQGSTISAEEVLYGDGKIYFDMPEGVESITYKVTFTNKKKQKNILKIQTTENADGPKGFKWGEH